MKFRTSILLAALLLVGPGVGHSQESKPPMAGPSYEKQLKELESENHALAAKVELAKAQLKVLEARATGRYTPTRARLTYKPTVDGLRLKELSVRMDGQELVTREFDVDADSLRLLDLFDGPIRPGLHKIEMVATYQGDSTVFTYFAEYEYRIRKSVDVEVKEGLILDALLVASRGNDLTKTVENQLSIAVETRYLDARDLKK